MILLILNHCLDRMVCGETVQNAIRCALWLSYDSGVGWWLPVFWRLVINKFFWKNLMSLILINACVCSCETDCIPPSHSLLCIYVSFIWQLCFSSDSLSSVFLKYQFHIWHVTIFMSHFSLPLFRCSDFCEGRWRLKLCFGFVFACILPHFYCMYVRVCDIFSKLAC